MRNENNKKFGSLRIQDYPNVSKRNKEVIY